LAEPRHVVHRHAPELDVGTSNTGGEARLRQVALVGIDGDDAGTALPHLD
jgi:hypothetical protein